MFPRYFQSSARQLMASASQKSIILSSFKSQLTLANLPTSSSAASLSLLNRSLHSTSSSLSKKSSNNDDYASSSLFGDFTSQKGSSILDTIASRAPPSTDSVENISVDKAADGEGASGEVIDYTKVDFSKDPDVIAFNHPTPKKAPELLLSDLKQQLYKQAIKQYGKYTPNQIITLDDGKRYKLYLTPEQVKYLEPSVYLHSIRIKGSYKKGTVFTRLLRNMDLKNAITQCHFSKKRIARDVGEMLTKGIDHAKQLDLDPNQLYISQIWVGKEPYIQRRIHFKGRGRSGIIHHPYIHVKAILKTKESKEEFIRARKERISNQRVWEQHHNSSIKVYGGSNQYQW